MIIVRRATLAFLALATLASAATARQNQPDRPRAISDGAGGR